jgi:ribosome maturation factor RimP
MRARSKVEVVYSEHFEKEVRDAVEPLLAGMGISLVELSLARLKGATRVGVVIHRKDRMPQGRGEQMPQGRGEQMPQGRGEQMPQGRGEQMPQGRGEQMPQGRGEGVGIDDCAEVSRLLLPRLQTIEGLLDVSLEVSSPGIERTIRSAAEYELFLGRGVKILSGTDTEWFSGIIDRVEAGALWLKKGKERRGFALAEIRKARLDYSVEVEEAKNAV